MAAKKKAKEVEVVETPIVHTKIELLSVDFGREDLNTVGRKINEIIAHLNEK